MAFFDDFSKHMDKIKKGAQKTAELARMQHQVAVKQSDFEKLFAEIGKLYYSERQRGVQPDATMEEPVKAPEETPAEEESRDVYIKWPDGSVKEEEKTEEASEEAAEAAQSDSAVEPEAAEETAEAPKEGAHEETHE